MKKSTKIGLIAGVAALVLIAGLISLIIFAPFGTGKDDGTIKPIDIGSIESTVDENGIRTVEVPTDENGNLKEKTVGSLVELQPSYLEKIKIENEAGIYEFECSTNSDGATSYTLLGFEDYDINKSNVSRIGTAISTLKMAAVVDVTGENKSDYGFDNPVGVATAEFTDDSKVVIYIGDDAPGGVYKYVMLEGCDSVFSVAIADVEPLCLNLNDMFNTSIRSDYSTVSDEDFTYIKLGGTHLAEELTIEHAPDGSLDAYYVLASHNNKPISSNWGSYIVGSIKSLTAERVAFANPDSKILAELGLDKPYATVEAEYVYDKVSDETGETAKETLMVSMICTEPDADGLVYMMDKGGKLVYVMKAESVDWSLVTLDNLRSEYAFAPTYSAVKSLTVEVDGKSYKFDVKTVITEEKDPETGEDVSTSTMTVTCGDKAIDEAYFRVLFDDMAYIPARGNASAVEKGNEKLITVTYEYSTEREADTVTFYATDSQKVIPEINGEVDTYVYKSDVSGIADNAKALSEGKEIKSIRG